MFSIFVHFYLFFLFHYTWKRIYFLVLSQLCSTVLSNSYYFGGGNQWEKLSSDVLTASILCRQSAQSSQEHGGNNYFAPSPLAMIMLELSMALLWDREFIFCSFTLSPVSRVTQFPKKLIVIILLSGVQDFCSTEEKYEVRFNKVSALQATLVLLSGSQGKISQDFPQPSL